MQAHIVAEEGFGRFAICTRMIRAFGSACANCPEVQIRPTWQVTTTTTWSQILTPKILTPGQSLRCRQTNVTSV
jgi:hypothetical protein